ncbi:MAG: PD40 domain-containing protein [Planctomycetes bacterium]|nr:PD40 domain-containing protein [Planctomycetota bacterium]
MLRIPLPLVAALLVLPAAARAQTDDEALLLRFPHLQGDRLAFTKGGDIWVAELGDLRARRLTSFDEGQELYPRISPDGTLVAFSGEYGGSRQIYVVPFTGGTPKQLTFYPDVGVLPPRGGYDNLPLDWTPDGRHILIRSNRTPYGERIGRYFLVRADGAGLEQPLQIPEGGAATFSPDGSKLAYNIISREWRTWKRYTAGRAQDVWVYDLTGNRIERITTFEGTDNFPMWVGDRIYFTSDREGGTLNLWCHELSSGVDRRVTSFADFDVLFPSRGAGGIVFEHGGALWRLDTTSERLTRLSITLADDRPWTRPRWLDCGGDFGEFTISPNAKRAVVEFRGDLFSVPAEHGEVRNLTRTPGRRERDPSWSPDGRLLAFVAEDGLDQELFVRSFGHGQETRLTTDLGAWIEGYAWSPDSRYIAVRDHACRLWVVDVRTRRAELRDTSPETSIGSVQWSKCGTWLCYDKLGRNGYQSIWLVRAQGGTPVQVTSDDWDDRSPSFDPGGRYLWFTSARDYQYGDHEFRQRIYALLLRDDVASPTAPREDEEPIAGAPKAEPAADSDGPLEIDLDGIEHRLVAIDLPSGRYGALQGVTGGLLFRQGGELRRYDLDAREAKDVLTGIGAHELSPDREHVLYRHGQSLCLARTSPGQQAGKDPLPLGGVRLEVHPPTEWAQMYTDAWRIMRDWFYDPNMHGVDWEAMRAKYLPLVSHVSHRSDLDFLLGELIGELNCGHTYVQPGETPSVPRVDVGTLGCELEVVDGRYRIAAILDAENWTAAGRNPLAEPGVHVAVGDYLLAIDGRELTAADNPYQWLVGKADRRVELLVNAAPRTWDARRVTVRPTASEQTLRYITWVNRNRELVARLSGGRIGYLHCPNTAIEGHRELFEGWRAQALVKDAMIVDDRYNGGGFIPIDMIDALSRRPLNWWARRHRQLYTTPQYAFEGPMIMLINGYSSSGGDAFPYYFRERDLGPLMGQRTWGGLVGYSGTPRLVDGGGLAVPAFAFVNNDGQWDVEAYGVAPDIEMFDDPTQVQAGREPMLEAAVRNLLERLEQSPPPRRPEPPRGPDRRGLVDPASAPGARDR